MNPDETKLAMWLDDELTGDELAEMNVWTADRPEQLAAREDLRKYRERLAANVSASEEPPYPDFFLTRVNQGIRDIQAAEESRAAPKALPAKVPFWKTWLMPVAACAGMIFAFGIGRQSGDKETSVANISTSAALTPVVYTPEEGVEAQWFAGNGGNASVIVLQGVSAIPDSTNFSETVYVPTARESDRTATRDAEESNMSKQ